MNLPSARTDDHPEAGQSFDVARARRDTPGAEAVAHLDDAGAALPPRQVTEAVMGHLQREAAVGGYEAAADAADQIAHTYDAIAQLLGCSPDEVALTENATRAWDMAFYGMRFRAGDRVLVSRSEYASNVIALLQVAARTGAVMEVIDDDEHGQLSIVDLRRRIENGRGRVALIAITHVPTQGGLVNPAEEVGAVARAAGIPYLLDACQSIGQIPVDVKAIGCDMLSATGRKFLRGPRGTGFLYVRSTMLERLEPPMLDLQAATWTAPDRYQLQPDARRFETWESNVAVRIGLDVAVDYALLWGLPAIEARVTGLAEGLRERLRALPRVRVHDLGQRRSGIVTFSVVGTPASDVQQHLRENGVRTTVSRARSAQLDLPTRGLTELIRASVHYYNTNEELDRLTRNLLAHPA